MHVYYVLDVKKMTPGVVCMVRKEDMQHWLEGMAADVEKKINVGYQRVCLRHKIDMLSYHVEKHGDDGTELHTVAARIPKSSKISPGKAKTTDEVKDGLVITASCD
jgi:hypothetical protein